MNDYYSHLREDVLAAVPAAAQSVLSVGCATGVTEERLIQRGVSVCGVEMNGAAAETARSRGVDVLEGDAARVDVAEFGRPFDCIVYADVLEHMIDPEAVLAAHVRHLAPQGRVYVTVPNFRNWRVLWALAVQGEIIYEDAGILDRTHVRITTARMVIRWLENAGLTIDQVRRRYFGRRYRYMSVVTGGLLGDVLAHHIAIIAVKPK